MVRIPRLPRQKEYPISSREKPVLTKKLSSKKKSMMLYRDNRVFKYQKDQGVLTGKNFRRVIGLTVVMKDLLRWRNGRFDCDPRFTVTTAGRFTTDICHFAYVSSIIRSFINRTGVIQSIPIIENAISRKVITFYNAGLNGSSHESIFQNR